MAIYIFPHSIDVQKLCSVPRKIAYGKKQIFLENMIIDYPKIPLYIIKNSTIQTHVIAVGIYLNGRSKFKLFEFICTRIQNFSAEN